MASFVIMNSDNEIRMTLRLPKALRIALEAAVANGSCPSVTAEIIQRLENSFRIDPLDTDDATALIQQYAAKIQDIVGRIAPDNLVDVIEDKTTSKKLLSTNEQRLLEVFNCLSATQQQTAIDVMLIMVKLIKT